MKYTRALDHVALALAALRDGKPAKLIAGHLAKAAQEKDLDYAISVLENSNAKAHEKMVAARIEAAQSKMKASKRLKAENEEEVVINEGQEATQEIDYGTDLVDGDEVIAEDEVEVETVEEDDDLSTDEVEILEDAVGGEDLSEELAGILASMRKNGK